MHHDSNCVSPSESVLDRLSIQEEKAKTIITEVNDVSTHIPDLQFDVFLIDIDHFRAEFSANGMGDITFNYSRKESNSVGRQQKVGSYICFREIDVRCWICPSKHCR